MVRIPKEPVGKSRRLRRQGRCRKRRAGAVTQVDIEHSKYQWIHAKLAIDQYKNEKIVNTYTADAKKAEMESAEEAIHRRKVCAPFDGVVQKITQHLGEWVKPGDPVVRLIRMDRLKVEGYLKVADYNPGDVMNRTVNVKVVLAGGREVSAPGQIVYVDPEVKSLREYMVRAEVDNRRKRQGSSAPVCRRKWRFNCGDSSGIKLRLEIALTFEHGARPTGDTIAGFTLNPEPDPSPGCPLLPTAWFPVPPGRWPFGSGPICRSISSAIRGGIIGS